MAFKFKQGDPVFHEGIGYNSVRGVYTVQQVGRDGMIYRIVDNNLDFTDADEGEITHVTYAVFTRVPEGWPIIVPVYLEKMYKGFLNSNLYRFVMESTAAGCLEEQLAILEKLDIAEKGKPTD